MCGGLEAREADKVWKIYFPNPKAAIPVLGSPQNSEKIVR